MTDESDDWSIKYYEKESVNQLQREDYVRFVIGVVAVSAVFYLIGDVGSVDEEGFYSPPPPPFMLGVAWTMLVYGLFRYVIGRREKHARYAMEQLQRLYERRAEGKRDSTPREN